MKTRSFAVAVLAAALLPCRADVVFQDVLLHNVSELVAEPDGLQRFRRVPQAVESALSAQGRRMNAGSTGVEIRFVLKGEKAEIRLGGATDDANATCLVYYGDFIADWPETEKVVRGRDTTLTIRPSPRRDILRRVAQEQGCRFDPDVVRIVLPQAALGIRRVSGAVAPPSPEQLPRKVYLAYGSSITHGSVATRQPMTYASLVGARLGADVRNLGFAGSCRLEPEMADYLAAQPFDYATIEMGINILGKDPVEFERRVRYLLDKVTASHPHALILGIDVFRTVGTEKHMKDAVQYREIVSRVIRELNRPNLVHVDGWAALPSPTLLSEGFEHPAPEGHQAIAAHLNARFAELETAREKSHAGNLTRSHGGTEFLGDIRICIR